MPLTSRSLPLKSVQLESPDVTAFAAPPLRLAEMTAPSGADALTRNMRSQELLLHLTAGTRYSVISASKAGASSSALGKLSKLATLSAVSSATGAGTGASLLTTTLSTGGMTAVPPAE